MKKIKVNRVQCKICGDIIESKYTHDIQRCSCGNVDVDGGLEYLKRSYISKEDYIELSEFEDSEDNE